MASVTWVAFLALLCTVAVSAEREWLMQEYQLSFMTRQGAFCRAVGVASLSGNLVLCDTRQAPDISSFNILTTTAKAGQRISSGDALQIIMRPGLATPINVDAASGLASSSLRARGSTLMLSPRAGSVGVPLHFGDTGSNPLFLSALVAGTNGTTTKYCRTGNYTVVARDNSTAVLSSVLLCDLATTEGAVQLTVRALGWSWDDKRIIFTNVFTDKSCGNIWFQNSSTYITCDNGTRAERNGKEWHDDRSSNVLRSMTLPMRSNTDFMVQTWIQYGAAMTLWQTDSEGDLIADYFTGPNGRLAPPGDIPYLSMVKNDGPSRNKTIGSGDTVLLRSSRTNGFCRVYGRLHQVKCTYSLHDVQAAPDRTIFQFIYEELVLSSYDY